MTGEGYCIVLEMGSEFCESVHSFPLRPICTDCIMIENEMLIRSLFLALEKLYCENIKHLKWVSDMEFPALIVVHQLETTVTKSIGSALCFELT